MTMYKDFSVPCVTSFNMIKSDSKMQRSARMKRELEMLEKDPPPHISCWAKDDKIDHLEAQILGGEKTPYAGGIFKLDIQVPERYPFEPPKMRFVTPIYHPNIDTAGRICLDILKMPPSGSWKPSLNISTVLTSLQLLMAEPNPDDPLMADIADEFKQSRHAYEQKAKDWTERHAMQDTALNGNTSKSTQLSSQSDSSSDSDSDQSDDSSDDENDHPSSSVVQQKYARGEAEKRILLEKNSDTCKVPKTTP
ncbi:ubiquitin-conjugating enzyme E2 T-like isoform X2 [Amphiura filiformis]|uniref:ubiquitin-conjugating enzyme E2 T-like isoform X2 n=1 Tax=Amphiura filiformis TaxID=82378 RepID=UPI003B217D0B